MFHLPYCRVFVCPIHSIAGERFYLLVCLDDWESGCRNLRVPYAFCCANVRFISLPGLAWPSCIVEVDGWMGVGDKR